MNILLVYPRGPDTFWSFKHVLKLVSKKAAFPPLGLLTVAAMLPRQWNLKLADLNVAPLADAALAWADYVFLSGMIVHKDSAHEVAARCAMLGKTVIAGGPLFTTGHEHFPEIRHFVLGEAEGLIDDLVKDLERGAPRPAYRSADWPDVRRAPVPRWDLIDLRDYVTMPVQFSRGCPFNCEFCDIVIMNGRVPRTKAPEQVLRELEALRLAGWRDMVFIVDDNFIGNRRRARELLRELMVKAGFKKVFLGIETPSAEGLEECGKQQNRRRDLGDSVRILQRAGLEVMGGFIVGFDSDPQDIFRRQFEFIQQSGVVTAMVGLLTALPQTELYRRLAREGRILAETCGNNTDAAINFITRLDREFLISGYRELMRELYEPRNYYARIRAFLRTYQPGGPAMRLSRPEVKAFLKSLWVLGVWHKGRLGYWGLFWSTLLASPKKFHTAMELSIMGHHFRRVASRL